MTVYPLEFDAPTRTVVLLGAGASKHAGVPTMEEFIDAFRKDLGDGPELQALDRMRERLVTRFGDDVDLELLLAALGRSQHLDTDLTAAIVSSELRDLEIPTLARVEAKLRDFVRVSCSQPVTPTSVQYLAPLMEFARSNGGTLDVFTLNYDLTIEIACEQAGVRCVDGFGPEWNPRTFDAEGDGDRLLLRLSKLHGSLVWYERPNYDFVKIPVLPQPSLTEQYFDHAPLEPLLLYPAFAKEGNRGIYRTLAERFSDALAPGNCDLLLCIGCSFRDPDIRTLIFEAAHRNTYMVVVVVDPEAHSIRDKFFGSGTLARERCITVPDKAEHALEQHNLLSAAGSIKVALARRRTAAAEAATHPMESAMAYKEVIRRFLDLDHIDGIQAIVEREVRSGVAAGRITSQTHLLPRLDVCMAMALVGGEEKGAWWTLSAPLLYWWEVNLQSRGGSWTADFVLPVPDDLAQGGELRPDQQSVLLAVDLLGTSLGVLDASHIETLDKPRLRELHEQMLVLIRISEALEASISHDEKSRIVGQLMAQYRTRDRCGDIARMLESYDYHAPASGLRLSWRTGIPSYK
jgi:hypothetical protein